LLLLLWLLLLQVTMPCALTAAHLVVSSIAIC
jgi:hypothetical protein